MVVNHFEGLFLHFYSFVRDREVKPVTAEDGEISLSPSESCLWIIFHFLFSISGRNKLVLIIM